MPNSGQEKFAAAAPAEMKVNPAHVRRYLEELDRCGCHSLIILRDGKVLTEAWWRPFRKENPHILFSVSKSFVAIAVGLAVQEGLLSLDERLVDIFPEHFPTRPCDSMCQATLRHLLTMSLGHRGKTDLDFLPSDDWLAESLHLYLENEPGAEFFYDNRCTYLVSAAMQRRSGSTVLDYLRPRLFTKLGIDDAYWETSPAGYTTGGWGLRASTASMALFGQFLLQNGVWNGERILSSDWLAEATRYHIDTRGKSILESENCWNGYGYFFWQSPYPGAYRADGALGQCIIVMPRERMVVAMTAGTAMRGALLDATWKHLCPGIDHVDEMQEEEQAALLETVRHLAIPPVRGAGAGPALPHGGTGGVFHMADNPAGIKKLSLITGDANLLRLWVAGGCLEIRAGAGEWIENENVSLPEWGSDVTRILYPHCAASSAWFDGEFVIDLAYTRTPFIDRMRLRFSEGGVEGVYECRPAFGARGSKFRLIGLSS